jgi:hypothetical protein
VGTGLRRFFPRRPAPPPRPSADPRLECGASDAELREFLSADDAPDEADPRFREELRRRLWTWLQTRWHGGSPPSDGSSPRR